jgi:hypothetical protein
MINAMELGVELEFVALERVPKVEECHICNMVWTLESGSACVPLRCISGRK